MTDRTHKLMRPSTITLLCRTCGERADIPEADCADEIRCERCDSPDVIDEDFARACAAFVGVTPPDGWLRRRQAS